MKKLSILLIAPAMILVSCGGGSDPGKDEFCAVTFFGNFLKLPREEAYKKNSKVDLVLESEQPFHVPDDITFTIDGEPGTKGTDYTYTPSEEGGVSHANISFTITGNVDITASIKEATQPLTFTATEDNSTLSLLSHCHFAEYKSISLDLIKDGAKATKEFTPSDKASLELITLDAGESVQIVSDNPGGFNYNNNDGNSVSYTSFVGSESSRFDVSGNIMSLISKNDFANLSVIPNSYCFASLFSPYSSATGYYESIVDASSLYLPATMTTQGCYLEMFDGNAHLTKTPQLPAFMLSSECYHAMFRGCISLTKAPYLPATEIGSNDTYYAMFQNCSSLNEIKIAYEGQFADTGTNFTNWVDNVSASGTFYYNGSSTTRGKDAIPSGWEIKKF